MLVESLQLHGRDDLKSVAELQVLLASQIQAGRGFLVLQACYSGECVIRRKRALKSAWRALGSTIRGKSRRRDSYACFVISPDGEALSWSMIKRRLEV